MDRFLVLILFLLACASAGTKRKITAYFKGGCQDRVCLNINVLSSVKQAGEVWGVAWPVIFVKRVTRGDTPGITVLDRPPSRTWPLTPSSPPLLLLLLLVRLGHSLLPFLDLLDTSLHLSSVRLTWRRGRGRKR